MSHRFGHISRYTGIVLPVRSSNRPQAVNASQHRCLNKLKKTLLTPFQGSLVWIRFHAFILILHNFSGGRYHQKKDISIIFDIVTQATV